MPGNGSRPATRRCKKGSVWRRRARQESLLAESLAGEKDIVVRTTEPFTWIDRTSVSLALRLRALRV